MHEAHVSDLVRFLNFLLVNHDYGYRILSIHANVICSILEPTEQMSASTAPIIKWLLRGIFRKNPPPRVCSQTLDVKKAIDLPCS